MIDKWLFGKSTGTNIPAKDIGIENGTPPQAPGNNFSKQSLVGPTNTRKDHVEEETPPTVEEEPKIHGNNDTKEFELGLQATNQKPSTRGVNCQYKFIRGRNGNHEQNLQKRKKGGTRVAKQKLK